MDFTVILEIAIGVVFIWVLLALITSALQEWISQLLKWRPTMLKEAIKNILANDALAEEFYKHPLIKSLHSSGGKREPSAIPNNQFASVVFDLISKAKVTPEKAVDLVYDAGTQDSAAEEAQTAIKTIRDNINGLVKDEGGKFQSLAGALDALLMGVSTNVTKADEAVADARQRVENWFEDSMVRLSGSYKRRTHVFSVIIGIVLAATINADSLAIANHLWREPLVRQALVAQAEQFELPEKQEGQDPKDAATEYYQQLQGLSENISFPLGWSKDAMPETFDPFDISGWPAKIIGILVSGAAAAQGAPFWFDIMKKLLNFRGGGSNEPAKDDEDK